MGKNGSKFNRSNSKFQKLESDSEESFQLEDTEKSFYGRMKDGAGGHYAGVFRLIKKGDKVVSFRGYGSYFDKNGKRVYQGEYYKSKFQGYGRLYGENGARLYEGKFIKGKRHGNGCSFYENGKPEYNGTWYQNKKYGFGVLYDDYGERRFCGEWRNGKEHGFGVSFNEEGEVEKYGYWKKGSFTNKKIDSLDST